MAAIRSEHETQNKSIYSQKSALDGIILELGALRVMGKEPEMISMPQSLCGTPSPDGTPVFPDADTTSILDGGLTPFNAREGEEDKKFSETLQEISSEEIIGDNDIEMGEVEEDPVREKSRKKSRDELEEGEASDASSELSDPPDD